MLREQLAQQRSKLAVAQEQLTQVQTAIAGIELNMTKAKNLVEKISQEIEWVESEDGLNGPSSEELAQTISEWTAKKDALNTTIQTNRTARTVLHEQVTEAESKLVYILKLN